MILFLYFILSTVSGNFRLRPLKLGHIIPSWNIGRTQCYFTSLLKVTFCDVLCLYSLVLGLLLRVRGAVAMYVLLHVMFNILITQCS